MNRFAGYILIVITLLPGYATAETTWSKTLSLSETYIDRNNAGNKDSGYITRIAPGIGIAMQRSKINLSLNYSLGLVANSGFDSNNNNRVDNSLNFSSTIQHDLNRWSSSVNARVSRSNVSADGLQIVDGISASDNTRELRSFGASTNYRGKLGEHVNYQTSLGADVAAYKGQPSSDGTNLNLSLQNSRSLNKLGWSAGLSSQKYNSQGDSQQVDSTQLGLSYQINNKLSSFASASQAETSNQGLNDPSYLIGLSWLPTRNTSLRAGIGERGDSSNYSLDATTRNKRLSLSANYSEDITNTRALVFDTEGLDNGLLPTSLSISIVPVLLKRGTITAKLSGKRHDLSLSVFNQETSSDLKQTVDRSDGVRFSAGRTLSKASSVQFQMSQTSSKSTLSSTVDSVSLVYQRQQSARVNYGATLSNTRQSSNDNANEYEQTSIGANMTVIF